MNEQRQDDLRIFIHRGLSSLSRAPEGVYKESIYSPQDVVQKVAYNINNYGYRSAEFDKSNEILVLGCSQTYGSGMPIEFIWPEIFSNSLKKKYSTVATPGDSINGQVYKAFKYFEEVGNPEIVVGLFPLHRLEYSSIPGKFISTTSWGQAERHKPSVGVGFFYQDYSLKISKAPHDPEYILPKEFALFYNFMFMKMLEQYCESHNIKFIWSIYEDEDIESLMQSTGYVLDNYLKTSDLTKISKVKTIADCSTNKHCSPEFKDHKLYEHAADYDTSRGLGHWGIHLHSHMASRFISRYMEIKND
jgi:hypothetical protein